MLQVLSTACSSKTMTKIDIYWGSYRIYIFVFLILLRIFVPRLDILVCINHYFIVCIFKYCTSLRLNYGLERRGTVFSQTISIATAQKR